MAFIKRLLMQLLIIPGVRTKFCKYRWKIYKNRLNFLNEISPNVRQSVLEHNLSAFNHDAAFGCGNRMSILLYPLSALIQDKQAAKVLVVGPRTEDDIFLSKALGFVKTKGVDLFSYSPYIELGDCHKLPYKDSEFDAVVLGWVIAYCGDPCKALQEAKRVLKEEGYLAVGWEWVPSDQKGDNQNIRGNAMNEVEEFLEAIQLKPVFLNSPNLAQNHNKSVIFRKNSNDHTHL
jgi:SAM-dependent methyltransferase